MKKLSSVYNLISIGFGLAVVLLIAAIKRIEEEHDDRYFWE